MNVDLVSVPVRVTDKQGHDVSGLTPEDFTLLENGQKQKVAFFDSEKEPINIGILVDSSTSMNLGEKTSATQMMLDQLVASSRLEDEISILQFTDRVLSYRQLTKEQRLMAFGATLSPSKAGGTALYDAIASGLCHMEGDKNIRQAVVVITDGSDQHSRLRLEELIRLVQASRAQLFMIGFYSAAEYEVYKQGDPRVTLVSGKEIDNPVVVFRRLAKESGADSFFPTTRKELDQAIRSILIILRAQYTLAYYPGHSEKPLRQIRVKLNRGGLNIRTRESLGTKATSELLAELAGSQCGVSAKLHPFPYESRMTKSEETTKYREDFTDARSGWPNRAGSRYTAKGYELSFGDATKRENQILSDPGLLGASILAAYGPWWDDFRASVVMDAGWAKLQAPHRVMHPKSEELLNTSASGLAFHVNDRGYYALLLRTTPEAYETDELKFKLVWRTYGNGVETALVPWTRVTAQELQKPIRAGMKLGVECVGAQITLFLDGQEVARLRDETSMTGYVGMVTIGNGRVEFRDMQVEGTTPE